MGTVMGHLGALGVPEYANSYKVAVPHLPPRV